jgi:hypothetical protein
VLCASDCKLFRSATIRLDKEANAGTALATEFKVASALFAAAAAAESYWLGADVNSVRTVRACFSRAQDDDWLGADAAGLVLPAVDVHAVIVMEPTVNATKNARRFEITTGGRLRTR